MFKDTKIIKCNVHDIVPISSLACTIINTPEFHRLRDIKQLAVVHYVFPTATHSRFEHSLGVYHLTGQILDRLYQLDPQHLYKAGPLGSVKLDARIRELIKIAGLCHDIGHGPFSHLFDDFLAASDHPLKYHEARSIEITKRLLKRETELSDLEVEFIVTIIDPRHQDVGALYQIVANAMNGIDADKFDYLARDSLNTGVNIAFCFSRLISLITLDDNDNISYPEKCLSDIYKLYHSRYDMHRTVYQHKTVLIIKDLILEILRLLDQPLHLAAALDDLDLFCKLTDNTIIQYLVWHNGPAKDIWDSIVYRNLKESKDISAESTSFKLFKNPSAPISFNRGGNYYMLTLSDISARWNQMTNI